MPNSKTKNKTKKVPKAKSRVAEPALSASEPLPEQNTNFETMSLSEILIEIGNSAKRYEALERKEAETITAIKEQKAREKAYVSSLWRFAESKHGTILSNQPVPALVHPAVNGSDGRSSFNPIKDLKISAHRSIEWSRSYAKTAEEARQRAIERVEASAKTKKNMSKVPQEVLDYIETLVANYAHLENVAPPEGIETAPLEDEETPAPVVAAATEPVAENG